MVTNQLTAAVPGVPLPARRQAAPRGARGALHDGPAPGPLRPADLLLASGAGRRRREDGMGPEGRRVGHPLRPPVPDLRTEQAGRGEGAIASPHLTQISVGGTKADPGSQAQAAKLAPPPPSPLAEPASPVPMEEDKVCLWISHTR